VVFLLFARVVLLESLFDLVALTAGTPAKDLRSHLPYFPRHRGLLLKPLPKFALLDLRTASSPRFGRGGWNSRLQSLFFSPFPARTHTPPSFFICLLSKLPPPQVFRKFWLGGFGRSLLFLPPPQFHPLALFGFTEARLAGSSPVSFRKWRSAPNQAFPVITEKHHLLDCNQRPHSS